MTGFVDDHARISTRKWMGELLFTAIKTYAQ